MHPAISRLAAAASVVLALCDPSPAAPISSSQEKPQKPVSQAITSVTGRPVVIDAQAAQQPRSAVCVVPDLSGTTASAAQSALASANLRVGATQNRAANRPRGTVVDQQPQPRTRIKCGATVDIWLAVAGTSDGPPTDTRCVVPDVSGHSVDDIRKVLAQAKLEVGRVTTRESDRPRGFVLAQSPSSGLKVACGSQVALIVAVPPVNGGGDSESIPTCVVPDVTGRLVDDIRKPLAQLKLEIGRITTRESDRPRGFVLGQSPASGTKVACGSQIAVLVAVPVDHGDTQPPPCVVPDLSGTDVGEIQRRLARANLVPGSVSDRPVDVRQGTIVSQLPRPGAQVKCRSQVDVWVAVPVTVACSAVPQLIGRDAKAAAAVLQRGGLRLGTVDERESNENTGVVIDQAPPAGFNAKCDTPVRIWVAVPQTLVIVPALRGNNETVARGLLERAGLVIGDVAQRPADQPIGAVVEQSPAAGTMVKRGSPVSVWLAQAPPITVPDVRGQDRATATNTLTTARLRLGETADRPSDRAVGTVVEQTPAPGTVVRPGTPVQVWFAVPLPATVPDVRGMDRSKAFDTLTAARLRLGETVDRQSNRTVGTIVEQTPVPGTAVRVGTPVHVWLAVAQSMTVPDVRGMDRARAVDTLTAARLRLGETADRPSDRTAGTIVEQTPAPGTAVAAGTAVQVWLAVAPSVTVPDVRGRDRANAAEALTTARLRLGEVGDRQSERAVGTVVEQTPAPGSVVPPGSAVQVWLAVAPSVAVPDLRGRDRAAANSALTTARLRLGEVGERASDRTAGTIVEQTPAPGSAVRPGSAVQVWLAVPAPPTVPDVRGRDRADAAAVLTAARLRLGEIRERQSDRTVGTVVEQSPAPGTTARPDTAVQVWLAVAPPSTVPDLRGRDRASAADAVTAAHLRLVEAGERQSDRAAGTVVDQTPAPGTSAPAGTDVQVWLAVPVTIEVPDLAGRPRAEAERLIAERGLVLRAAIEERSTNTAGTVLRQVPLAGARVSPGSGVDLVLALAVAPVQPILRIPDLVGRSEAEARAILQAVGLTVRNVTQVRARTVTRTVVRQLPAAGTEASAGAAVDLEVATFDLALLWMLGAGLGLGAAAAGLVSRVRRGGSSQPAPAISLAPHADSGVQTTVPDARGLASSELSLQGFGDSGTQSILGPAVLVLDVAGGTR